MIAWLLKSKADMKPSRELHFDWRIILISAATECKKKSIMSPSPLNNDPRQCCVQSETFVNVLIKNASEAGLIHTALPVSLQIGSMLLFHIYIYKKKQGLAAVAKQHKRVKCICLLGNKNADKVSRFSRKVLQ